MKVIVELTGKEDMDHATQSLQDWIQKEQIDGLNVNRGTSSPKKDDMGADLLPLLQIVISSGLVEMLVTSIFGWIKDRRSKSKIKITIGNKVIEIDGGNPMEIKEILASLE